MSSRSFSIALIADNFARASLLLIKFCLIYWLATILDCEIAADQASLAWNLDLTWISTQADCRNVAVRSAQAVQQGQPGSISNLQDN